MPSKAGTNSGRKAQLLQIGDKGVRILKITSNLLFITGAVFALWGPVYMNIDRQLAMMIFILMFALGNQLQIKALGEKLGIGAFSGQEIPDKRPTSDSEE